VPLDREKKAARAALIRRLSRARNARRPRRPRAGPVAEPQAGPPPAIQIDPEILAEIQRALKG